MIFTRRILHSSPNIEHKTNTNTNVKVKNKDEDHLSIRPPCFGTAQLPLSNYSKPSPKTLLTTLKPQLPLTLSLTTLYIAIRTVHLSLPIPPLAPLLSFVLPLLTYLSLHKHLRPPASTNNLFSNTLITLLSLLDVALITLSSTSLPTSSTTRCTLELRWRQLFQSKNALAIRRIQDALECCGLRTVRDNAWPFPDIDHGADACVVRFGRQRACLEPWAREERWMVGVMIAVGVLSLAAKVCFRSSFTPCNPGLSWLSGSETMVPSPLTIFQP